MIDKKKWEYKYKHRFDKSSTAKCYCKDCKSFGANRNAYDRNECGVHEGWRVADEWFCWCADPCEKDLEMKEKELE